MSVRKFIVASGVWVLFFLVILGETWANPGQAIRFSFGTIQLSSEVKAVVKDSVKYINLPFIVKHLHMITSWDPDSGEIFLQLGQSKITLTEDSTRYMIDGRSAVLAAAPFKADDQLWLPVELLLRLGLVITKEDERLIQLDWAEKFLLAMEKTTYDGRPAYLLVGTDALEATSFLLTGPDRLVVDLPGYKAHPAFAPPGDDQLVRRIRYHQYQSDVLRLVFDLDQLAGYQMVAESDDQLLVVFNYFVENIRLVQLENERKIYIKTSAPSKYSVKAYQKHHLIIDFEGATLGMANQPISGDNLWIQTIRMSQFDRHTVRVVLDLVEQQPTFVQISRTDPTVVEVRTVQSLTALRWSDTENGGILTLESDGELVETIQKAGEKLKLNLDYAVPDPELELPVVTNDFVRNLTLIAVSPSQSQLEMDLGKYVGYTVSFGADRRSMTIHFTRSHLLKRTIVLDPGHGGADMGATGRQGTREKDVNFDVAMRLKKLLEEAGAAIVLTRTDDSFISLYERSAIANDLFADLFISIHTNAHPQSEVRGIEVFYYQGRNDSERLAKAVEARLATATQLKSLGVKTNDFVVVRESQMPGILIELGFLSNFEEEKILRTDEYRERAARGIFEGIIDYYENLGLR